MPALRVFDGDVMLAGASDFQPGFLQGHKHILSLMDFPLFHKGQHIGVDGLPDLVAPVLFDGLAPAQKPGLAQAGMLRRVHPPVSRVVWSGPAFADIVHIAEYVKVLLPAGRAGIERLAAGKLHARDDKVQFVMPGMAVPNPEDMALIRIQPGKGHPLEVVHDALFLLRRDGIGGMPGQNPGGETPFATQRINQLTGQAHISAQDFRRTAVAARIVPPDKVLRGGGTVPLAVRKNFHQHDGPPAWGGGGVSFNSRSRLMSAASTAIVSARLLWVLAHRAIWFRFAPMRASCRMRSFSSGICRRR